MAQAAAGGVELVVLPEAAMCGFGGPAFDLAAMAEPLDGPFVSALAVAAARHGVTALAGMFEQTRQDGRVFNTVVVVGLDGLSARYRKLHLFDALGWRESERVRRGETPERRRAGRGGLSVGELRVGVMTCYDLRFPEMARALVDAGATAIALPAAWVSGAGKVEQWSTLVRARAIENTAYVVAAGQPGPDYSGNSMIVDPAGVVLAALDADGNGPGCLAVAELSVDRVADVRRGLPVLEHRRFAVRPRLAADDH